MSIENISENIGKSIKSLRLERNWTQDYLAELVGYSVRNLRRIENKGTINLATIIVFAEIFDMPLNEILN